MEWEEFEEEDVDPVKLWKGDSTLQYTEGSLLWRLAELCLSMREEELSEDVLNFQPNPEDKLEWAGDEYVRRIYYNGDLREREQ